MASTTTELKVQALYVGYLGRAAELSGRDFWADNIEAGRVTYQQVAADFAQSPEYQTLYAGLTIPQLVNALYTNVLGRPSDPAGLQFWVDQVTSGAVPQDLLVLYMIDGMSAADRVRFDTRVQDGNAYTEAHPNDYNLQDAQDAVGLLNELVAQVNGVDATSVNEGQTVQFHFSTINFAPGSVLNYQITGVSAADVVGGQLSGQVVLDVMNKAVISVTLAADATTEGAESMSLALGGLTTSITVADTSTTPPPPVATYAIAAAQAGYDEGQTASFNVVTTNVAAGTLLGYTISGVQAADVVGGKLNGTTVVGPDGKAAISVELVADKLTEGNETMTVALNGTTASASTVVVDTSTTPVPGYTITAAQAGYNEGDTALFNVVTTNVAAGTELGYTISGAGISGADVAGGVLKGTTVVDADGKATIQVTLLADQTTEGAEVMTVTLAGVGASASVKVEDTSKTPTYNVVADQASVVEGSAATFTLTTANVAAGTVLNYSVGGGVNAADIAGPLTGTVTVGSDGKGTITVPTKNDGVTEGTEALTVTVTVPGGANYAATTNLTDNPAVRLTSGQDGTASQPLEGNLFDGSQEQTALGPVNTLNDTDHLKGTGATDVLNAVIGNAGFVSLVTPNMTGVETVNLEIANSLPTPVALSLEDTTGTTAVNVTRISGGLSAIVQDMNKEVTSLSAANTVLPVPNIIFDYRAGQAPSTVALALTNVTVNDLNIGVGAKAGGTTVGTGIGTLNLTSNGTNVIGTSTANGLDSAVTTLGLTVNSSSLTIKGLNEATLATINASGAGNLVLDEVGSAGGFSLAAGGMTGNVTAKIDNAAAQGNSSFVTGSGNDTLTTDTSLGGDIATNDGNDTVNIKGNVNGSGSILTGKGTDTVTVGGLVDFGGLIDGGDDADTITIGGEVRGDGVGIQPEGGVYGGTGGDTITIGGPVSGIVDSGADGDGIYLNGGVLGTGYVNAGSGADYVGVTGDNAGTIDLGIDNDSFGITGNNSGSLILNDGDDVGTINGANTGSVSGGAGGDFVWILGTVSGSVNMGAGNDVLRTTAAVVQTTGGTTVDMSGDDDVFEQDFGGGAAVTQVANATVVQGGSGTDAFVARNQGGTYTIGAPTQPAAAVGGFENMWLTANGGTFNVDFANVDSTLAAIRLNTYDGTTGTYNLANLAGESLALTNVQVADPGGSIYGNRPSNPSSINFDGAATANLNVSSAAAGATLNLTLEGEQAFTVNLDDTTGNYASLALNVANTTDSQVVNFATVGGDDFATKTTVTGGASGQSISLNQVDSRVVDAKIAANMNIVVGARADDGAIFKLDREIYTGSGDDVVDFRNAYLDGGNGVTTLGDIINLGLGVNRLIIDNSTDVTPDRDEAFESVKGATILQVDGVGTQYFLGDDAYAAGIKILETTSGSQTTVETGLGFGGFELQVNLALESDLTLKNEVPANNDLDIRVELDATITGAGQGTPSDDDATLRLAPAGSGNVALKVRIDDDTPTWITTGAVADVNGKSELSLTVDAASGIDSIKLFDNNVDIDGDGLFDGGDADNQNVYIAVDNSWANAALTIDASGIDNFDGNTATGAVFIDASDEASADLTIKGSANDNTIVGGKGVNSITTGAGNDVVIGGGLGDTINTFGGDDVVYGLGGDDTINAGSGNDYLVGGAGEDDLTGGLGSDVFDYLNGKDSSVTAWDVIRDFDFKVDAFSVSNNIELVGSVTIEDQIGAANPGNLFTFLESRSEIQSAFALAGSNALFVTILSPNFPGGGINGATGDVTVMLIEDGTLLGDLKTFDSKDIMIELDDDGSYANPGWFSLANFGPFGDGTAITAPSIVSFADDTAGVSNSDNLTYDNDLLISGTAEAGAEVTVFHDADGDNFQDWNEHAWTVTADGAGDWSVQTGTLADGKYTFHAQQSVTGTLGGTFLSPLSNALKLEIDTVAPTVTVSLLDDVLNAGDVSTTVFIKFSEAVDPATVDLADLDASGAAGTLSLLTPVTKSLYTATFTPTAPIEDYDNVISFSGAYTDEAGNAGLPGTSDNFVVDNVAPTVVSITLDDYDLIAGETALVTFQFSEPVVKFNAILDAVAESGNLSDFTAIDEDTYTAVLTPWTSTNDATNVVTVNGPYEDLAGNAGAGGSSANYTVETTIPYVAFLTMDDYYLTAGETALVTIDFSEDVTGFDVADITMQNGTLSSFTAVDGNTYTVKFTPNAPVYEMNNDITISDDYWDLAGNQGEGTTFDNWYSIDTRTPVVVTSVSYDVNNNVINLIGTGFASYVGGEANGFEYIVNPGGISYTLAPTDVLAFNILGDTQIQVVLAGGTAAIIETTAGFGGIDDDLFIDAGFLVDSNAIPAPSGAATLDVTII